MDRRQFVQSGIAASIITGVSPLALAKGNKAQVVIVGGGYAGATAAKYIRLLSNYKVNVTLIEPNASFVSCPMSNLVVGGIKKISDISSPYTNLQKRHGVKMIKSTVTAVDAEKKTVTLADGKIMHCITKANTMGSLGHEPQTRRVKYSQQFRMTLE